MEKDTDSNSELNKYGVWIKTPPRTAKEGDVEVLAPAEPVQEPSQEPSQEPAQGSEYTMPDYNFLNKQEGNSDNAADEDLPLADIPPIDNESIFDAPEDIDVSDLDLPPLDSPSIAESSIEEETKAESEDLTFETVPKEDVSVEEEGSNILDDGITEIDVNSFMDEGESEIKEPAQDEEVSIDDFLDGSTSTPDGDVSINEFISSNDTNPIGEQDNFVPDGEISLDAFLDAPLESSQAEQKQEEQVYEEPIDIDLSFDDTLKVETEENSELDDILDDFTSQDSSASSSAGTGTDVDLSAFLSDDAPKQEGDAAPKKQVSMEDTTEAISADDFDSMFGPSDSDSTASASSDSQSVDLSDFGISEDEGKPEVKAEAKEKRDFDLKVSTDDGNLEENSAEGIGQETEDDNISIYMDDTSKKQERKEPAVKADNSSSDDFDLDSLLDSIEDESGKTVSIQSNEQEEAPLAQSTDASVAEDSSVTEEVSPAPAAEDATVTEDATVAEASESFGEPEVIDSSEFQAQEDSALTEDVQPAEAEEPSAQESDATLTEDATVTEEPTIEEETGPSFDEPDVFEGTEFIPQEDFALPQDFQKAVAVKEEEETKAVSDTDAKDGLDSDEEAFNPFAQETGETVFEEADLEDPSIPKPDNEDTISYSTEDEKAHDGEDINIATFLGSEDFEDPIDSMVEKELKVQAEEQEEKLKKDIDESANSDENGTIDNDIVEPETTGEGNMDNAFDNNELLTQIVDDLKEVKNEISNLKSEFEEFKRNGAGSESEEVIEPVVEPIPSEGDKGFFGDEDDDDTIALSGDELTNILSSAEMTSENSDGEQELEAPSSSADVRESVQTEEDILGSAESMPEVPSDYNPEGEETSVDFANESLEEPNLDEVEIGSSEDETEISDQDETDVSEEEEIEVPKVDDILVESSNSDFIENAITGDVPAPAEEEGEFTEVQDFEEPAVGEEELKAEAEEQSERLAAELSDAEEDSADDEGSSDTTPEMDQILATIHQENMEKDKIHPEVYDESEESSESPLEEPVAPVENEAEKELDIEALKNEALEEFDEPEVVENEDAENESSVEVEYIPATGGDPFANEEKPELTEDNIEFLKEDEDEKIEPGISEEPVTKVFNGWENPDKDPEDNVSEEEAAVPETEVAEEASEEQSEPALDVAEEAPEADDAVSASGLSAAAQASSGDLSDSSEDTPAEAIPEELKEEIKTVLSYMDQLLENLPEEKIEEFARSEQFSTYKKLFKELGLS